MVIKKPSFKFKAIKELTVVSFHIHANFVVRDSSVQQFLLFISPNCFYLCMSPFHNHSQFHNYANNFANLYAINIKIT